MRDLAFKVAGVLVTIGVAALLTGCGSPRGPQVGKFTPLDPSAPASSSAPTEDVVQMGAAAGVEVAGLTVTVGLPTKHKLSHYGPDYAAEGDAVIKFDVTVINGRPTPFSSQEVVTEVTIGGVQAHPVFDIATGIGDTFGTIIPAGRPLKVTQAWVASTQDTSVIDVIVRPISWTDSTQIAIFRGSV